MYPHPKNFNKKTSKILICILKELRIPILKTNLNKNKNKIITRLTFPMIKTLGFYSSN